MKKLKNFYNKSKTIITILGVLILLLTIVFLVYKIFFSKSNSDRFEGIKSHELSSDEIKNIKEVINTTENIENIDIYVRSKIIRILVTLDKDVQLDVIKDTANKTIAKIDKDNLKFYDVEFYVDTKDKSEIYPKIGYKHKSNDKFEW